MLGAWKPTMMSATWTPGRRYNSSESTGGPARGTRASVSPEAARGVAEMSDVRRFVGIDRGGSTMVFRGGRIGPHGCDRAANAVDEEGRTVQIKIQVTIRRGVDLRDTGNRADRGGELLHDGARRLAQRARQLKRDRHRQIAEGTRRRDLDGKRRHIRERKRAADRIGDRLVDTSLNGQNHVRVACRAREGALSS
jgi:hypothetical protein